MAENTFEVNTRALESARTRAGRGWGVGALPSPTNGFYSSGRASSGSFPAGCSKRTRRLRRVPPAKYEETGIDGLAAIAEQTFTDGRTPFVFHFAAFDATPESTDLTTDPGIRDEPIHDVAWHDSLPENIYDHELYSRLLDCGAL